MSQVLVITEEVYRKRTYRDETQRMYITSDNLVDVLNSCAKEGSEREEYVLVQDFKE
jgi:hypothetical protein